MAPLAAKVDPCYNVSPLMEHPMMVIRFLCFAPAIIDATANQLRKRLQEKMQMRQSQDVTSTITLARMRLLKLLA